ncbi:hypothetical protein CPC08DRAFT_759758 [Agrocybe pediades]|nr:hypothetical protein CPC08DRAFT_759758 [Agrocybe pediades]
MGALVQIHTIPFPPGDREYDPESPAPFLRILHASFQEYLVNAARSKQFYIDIDYKRIRRVTHALQYLASCCSSSFDLNSKAGSPIDILYYQQYYIRRRVGVGQIAILLKLRQSVLSFPLKEFLGPHISTRTFPQLLQRFVTPYMQLLEAMALNLSFIQGRPLAILRSVLMQQLQRYFNNDRLAAILVLFYHLGSHRFVPYVEPVGSSSTDSHSALFDLVPAFNEGDILSLSVLWTDVDHTLGDNIYHRYMRRWLCDQGQTSGEYALGPVMHERAALVCLKELARTVPLLPPSPSGKNIDISPVIEDTEDDAYPKLKFFAENGGEWKYGCFPDWDLDYEDLYFLLLGYVIFLLPRCGRSDALVAACEEHGRMSYIDQPCGPLPVRRKLASVSDECLEGRNSFPGGGPDLIGHIDNFSMDYSYDAWFDSFTEGQAVTMRECEGV